MRDRAGVMIVQRFGQLRQSLIGRVQQSHRVILNAGKIVTPPPERDTSQRIAHREIGGIALHKALKHLGEVMPSLESGAGLKQPIDRFGIIRRALQHTLEAIPGVIETAGSHSGHAAPHAGFALIPA